MAGHGFPRRWNLLDHVHRIHSDDEPIVIRAINKQVNHKPRPQRSKRHADIPTVDPEVYWKADWDARLRLVETLIGLIGSPGADENLHLIREAQLHLSLLKSTDIKAHRMAEVESSRSDKAPKIARQKQTWLEVVRD